MVNRCLVVSCKGLGDGIIALTLSNNLYLNQNEVVTFHDGGLFHLQSWFPHLPIEKFPGISAISCIVQNFDQIYVFHDSVDPFIQALIKERKDKI